MELELNISFFEPEPVVEVEEPSVLEYAREQGICVDYTTELPRLVDICLSLKRGNDHDPQDQLDYDPQDGSDEDLTNAARALTRERLALNKEAASLLKSVLGLRQRPNDNALATEGRQICGLKLELPVLQTDAELDMLHFGTRVEPDFRDLRTRIPSEDLDEENDEGFAWPSKYTAYPAQCDARLKSERLAIPRDALAFLQNAVEDEFSTQDEASIMAQETEYRRNLIPRYLTPPLMPLSPPSTPYVPSSPANRLPLIPESSDSVTDEAKALEQQIMAEDSLIRHHSSSSDSMLLDVATSPHFLERAPESYKRKADGLKVEGPLTPPILSDSPMKKLKSVTFSNMVQVSESLQPWADEQRSGTSDSESAMDELFNEIEPIAKEADRKVENEKLTGADTISRVDIPVLDFTLPVAPWDEFSLRKDKKRRSDVTELEAQMRFLQHVKRDDLRSATTWHGASDLVLSWGWFASPTSSIKLDEQLHGKTEFDKIQAELKAGNIATSANEVWKRDGLRILDEDEDEDDEWDGIEHAEIEEQNDVETLIRKRKLEMQEHEELMEAQRKRRQAATMHAATATQEQSQIEEEGFSCQQTVSSQLQDPRKTHHASTALRPQQPALLPSQHQPAGKQKKPSTELMFGGFSASAALHKFMETQGKAIPTAKATAQAADPVSQTISQRFEAPFAEPNLFVAQSPDSVSEGSSHHVPEPPPPPLDLPPSSFIVSSTLLQRRRLLKQIESLHPEAELVYRDYSLPHSAAAEADIILSPSTGVILTTLQQIKQAPLPGQPARSLVKERMATLQDRYERLVVLISEGLREDLGYTRPEDVRDKETLKGLGDFAAQLEGDVEVQYIRGGEQTLSRAIVEHMAKYGLPHGGEDVRDIRLFPMETTWEVFLRRAGINAFAAQVILCSLKIPRIVSLPSPSTSPSSNAPQRSVQAAGLPTFLLMEREDRAQAFQAIMGGRRILDRVSAVLDQEWQSTSNVYRV